MTRFDLLVVDDFLEDPDRLRRWALAQEYVVPEQFYGLRSHSRNRFHLAEYDLREKFEDLLDATLIGFESSDTHGRTWLSLPHADGLEPGPHTDCGCGYACLVYLTPGLPLDCGTSFWRHRPSGLEREPDYPVEHWPTSSAPLDRRLFEETDRVAWRYNRAVLYPPDRLHSATRHYGSGLQDGRLHTMFMLRTWK